MSEKTPHELAADLTQIDTHIADLESSLSALKDQRKELVTETLPKAMRKSALTGFDTDIGNKSYHVKITNKIVGALSRVDDVDAALDYLKEKGFDGAAKSVVSVTVPDDQRDEVIAKVGDYTAKVERKIHPSTLAAFARECISNGTGFDLDKVGLSSLTETTIKEKN